MKSLENYKQNLHTHSIFCDGKDTPNEVVKKAIEQGFDSIGFSGHAPMFYSDYNYKYTLEEYCAEIYKLKEEYKGKLDIYCGLEFDAYCGVDLAPYEYTLGALHYLKVDGRYIAFDRSADFVLNMIDREFGGKGIEFAKEYYRELADLRKFGKFDIVAHFDLVTKNSEIANLFDTDSKEYRNSALETLTALREDFDIFEINTGAISRGYRTSPYPQKFILEEMKRLNCKIVITSDCHNADYLTCSFDMAKELAKSCGFKEQVALIDGKFTEIPL